MGEYRKPEQKYLLKEVLDKWQKSMRRLDEIENSLEMRKRADELAKKIHRLTWKELFREFCGREANSKTF